jgi:hypothetical protein
LNGTPYYGGPSTCNSGVGCRVVFAQHPPAVPHGEWRSELLCAFRGGSVGESPFAPLALNTASGAPFGSAPFRPLGFFGNALGILAIEAIVARQRSVEQAVTEKFLVEGPGREI